MSSNVFNQTAENESLREPVESGIEPGGLLLGSLQSLNLNGSPVVEFNYKNSQISAVAISTTLVTHQHIGRQVALLFADNDLQKPVIMGFIHSPLNDLLESFSLPQIVEVQPNTDKITEESPFESEYIAPTDKASSIESVRIDGKKLIIEGQEEIVFTCGESSITLTRAGKILIRGKYLLSRSSGVNRIMGGSVQVN